MKHIICNNARFDLSQGTIIFTYVYCAAKGLVKMTAPCDPTIIAHHITITEDDIYAAMKEMPGYIDITPGDFKELYVHACRHAMDTMARSITAARIMTREVTAFNRGTALDEVARIMAENNFSGAPVTDDAGMVVGVISEKDFLYCIAGKGARSFLSMILEFIRCSKCVTQTIEGKNAEDIMSSPAITITETTPVIDIIQLFSRHAINRVPVVDAAGHICGIITRADLLKTPLLLRS
jgi:CBS domain-containing protein